jgi:hypothetical protein
MYVWELVSCRLRADGWDVWHSTKQENDCATYTVHLRRPGTACEVSGPTLTEAYAAAARQVRDPLQAGRATAGPHFPRGVAMAWC